MHTLSPPWFEVVTTGLFWPGCCGGLGRELRASAEAAPGVGLVPARANGPRGREIAMEWIQRTLDAPELSMPDPNDSSVERRFRRIPEFGRRVLRVAVNMTVEPKRVVSVFFDRTMKGKL
jgi:hypothetical protein